MTALFTNLPRMARQPRRKRPAEATASAPVDNWPLQDGINVVLFAGMGGACQGLEDAGFPVHVAVNHDEIAIAAHKALNPHTKHIQADIYEVDPIEATDGRRVNILWGSPDCRDHSVAKGGAPRSPRVRSMPWQLCRWVGVLRKRGLGPASVYLENVREIRGWGRLIAKRDKETGRVIKLDGTVAAKGERTPVREQMLVRDPKCIGRTYRAWVRHIRSLGANYEDRDLCCADYKVPTIRKRLFGVALFDNLLPAWPVVTHGHRKCAAVQAGQLQPHVPAATIIDWSIPMRSIFDRDKPHAEATQKRVAVGVGRYVIGAEKPFLVHLTHHGARPAMSLDDAAATITGAHRGEVALVGPALIPTTHSKCPPRAHDGAEAAPTMTAAVKGGEFAVVAGSMIQTGYGERDGQAPRCLDIKDPVGTQVAGGAKHAVVAAHLTKFQQNSIGQDVEQPIDTVMAGAARFGVVGAYLQEHRTHSVGQPADEALTVQTTKDHHSVVAAWMVQLNNDGHGNIHQGRSLDAPMGVLTTTGSQMQLGGAFLVHQRGTSTAASAEDAIRALTTGGARGGDHVGVSAVFLTEYYGTGGQHCAADEALNTLSTADRFAVNTCSIAELSLTPFQYARARQTAEFLRRHGVWEGGDIVIVRGWILWDICMRMLTPKEAAAAHELRLPDLIRVRKRDRKGNVVLDDAGAEVWIERPLTKTEAMRLVGNSVPKRMAMLLAQANAPRALAVEAAE